MGRIAREEEEAVIQEILYTFQRAILDNETCQRRTSGRSGGGSLNHS